MNPLNPEGDANCWLSCALIAEGSGVTPDMVMDALAEENIESRPIWKPMHLQPVFAECDFVGVDDAGRAVDRTYFSITDEEMGADDSVSGTLFSHGVCMPSDTKMDDADLVRICDVVNALWK